MILKETFSGFHRSDCRFHVHALARLAAGYVCARARMWVGICLCVCVCVCVCWVDGGCGHVRGCVRKCGMCTQGFTPTPHACVHVNTVKEGMKVGRKVGRKKGL